MTNEIKPLTTLRALAAALVFLYHYAVLHAPDGGAGVPLRAVWAHGYMGVPIFFVLSGFLITRIYFDALNDRAVSLRTFLVKRVARIWPLFLLLTTGQHIGLWILGREAPSADWLVTMSMSQGWFAGLLYRGLSPTWSLTIEETFYLLVPVFCLVIGRLAFPGGRTKLLDRDSWIRLLATLALLVVTLAAVGEISWRLANALGLNWQGFLADRDHVLRMTLAGRLPEFAVGMLIAFIHRDGRLLVRIGPRIAGLITVLALLAMGGLMASKEIAPPGVQLIIHNLVSVAAGILVLALCVPNHGPGRILSWGPLVYLGRISYGFYLIQLALVAEPLARWATNAGPARLLVLFILLNLVSAGLYEGVERPSRRWIVEHWDRPRG